MNKLLLPPDQNGYSVNLGADAVASPFGNSLFFSKNIPGSVDTVSVKWTVDIDGFSYLTRAFRHHEASGHAPFLIDLTLDGITEQEYKVVMVPGTFGVSGVAGETFTLSATLEVERKL